MKKTLLVLSLFVTSLSFSQSKYKLSGKVTQAKNNTPLASTTVTVALNNDETVLQTDNAGNYSLMAASGTYQLSVYVEGFEYVSQKIDLTKDV
ncbi:MAG: carboxypeptidase-like regulatory domain-containing protein, partial [Myroides sp.]